MKSIILVFLLLFGACAKQEPASSKPIVLTNIAPYAYFLNKIGGDTIVAKPLIPSGANPHLFEPTLRDVEPLKSAKVWLRIGEPFEDKIINIIEQHNPTLLMIDLSEGIDLIREGCAHCDHAEDRHIWLSPKEGKKQAIAIKEALVKAFPENGTLYEENLLKFLSELDSLDAEITEMLEPLSGQAIVVSHPAFGYFCRDYGLKQLSVEQEGKDPLPQHISELLQTIEQNKISAIFAEPQYSNKGAELIAEKLHLQLYMVDPYSGDYPTTLRNIAKQIANKQ